MHPRGKTPLPAHPSSQEPEDRPGREAETGRGEAGWCAQVGSGDKEAPLGRGAGVPERGREPVGKELRRDAAQCPQECPGPLSTGTAFVSPGPSVGDVLTPQRAVTVVVVGSASRGCFGWGLGGQGAGVGEPRPSPPSLPLLLVSSQPLATSPFGQRAGKACHVQTRCWPGIQVSRPDMERTSGHLLSLMRHPRVWLGTLRSALGDQSPVRTWIFLGSQHPSCSSKEKARPLLLGNASPPWQRGSTTSPKGGLGFHPK